MNDTRLKAYAVSIDSEFGNEVVWAEARGKAVAQVMYMDRFEGAEFTDFTCHRAQWADNLQHATEDNLILAELKQGWTWYLEGKFGPAITQDDVPAIEKAGGFSKFCALLDDGKIKTAEELEDE